MENLLSRLKPEHFDRLTDEVQEKYPTIYEHIVNALKTNYMIRTMDFGDVVDLWQYLRDGLFDICELYDMFEDK